MVLGARRRRPAHAGEAASGENAIEAMVPVIAALRALEAELNVSPPPPYADYPHPINLNVGTIRGGDWPSTVAGECVAEMRLALYPGERRGRPAPRIEETVAAAAESDAFLARCTVEVRYDGFACEGYVLERDPVIDAVGAAAARVYGAGAAAVRLDGDDRRAHVPALRRDARDLLRAVRGADPLGRRARPPAVGRPDRAGAGAPHPRLVRLSGGSVPTVAAPERRRTNREAARPDQPDDRSASSGSARKATVSAPALSAVARA